MATSNTKKLLIGGFIALAAIAGLSYMANATSLASGLRTYITDAALRISGGNLVVSPKVRVDNNSNSPFTIDRVLVTVYQLGSNGQYSPIGSTPPNATATAVPANGSVNLQPSISIPLLSLGTSLLSYFTDNNARKFKIEALIQSKGVEQREVKEIDFRLNTLPTA